MITHNKFKLEAYAAFTAAFLSGEKLSSQIIMQDFDPDLRLMNWVDPEPDFDSVQIDIDGNGEFDLMFYFGDDPFGFGDTRYVGLDINDAVIAVAGHTASWTDIGFADALASIDVIGPYNNWIYDNVILSHANPASTTFYCYAYYHGSFNSYRKYAGLKFLIDDTVHYGWVRLYMDTFGKYYSDYCFDNIGSPLVVYELGYENIADMSVFPQTNALKESLNESGLFDNLDTNDFNEFVFRFRNYGVEDFDYDKLRIYLSGSVNTTLSFTVQDAVALDSSRYAELDTDSIAFYDNVFIHFNSNTKDIDGNPYVPGNYYTVFFMKMPEVIDTSSLSLSFPMKLKKAEERDCDFYIYSIDLEVHGNSGTAADFNCVFHPDNYENSIASYRIALTTSPDEDYNISEAYPTGRSIVIPETFDDVYDVNLEGIIYDITGTPIITGEIYYPVIFGDGDPFFQDVFCTKNGLNGNELETGIINYSHRDDINILSADNILSIQILNQTDKETTLEIFSINGEMILSSQLNTTSNKYDLNYLPSGIYMATVYQNKFPVAVSKISILH